MIYNFISIMMIWATIFHSCKEKIGKQINSNSQEIPIVDPFEPMPRFPGGEMELFCFLDNNLDKGKLASVEVIGTTVAQFLIDTTGEVKEVRILKKLNPIVDKEFERVLRLMPKWESGEKNGKIPATKFTFPLRLPYENRLCKKQ